MIGISRGAAFGKIESSLVGDIIMPPIGVPLDGDGSLHPCPGDAPCGAVMRQHYRRLRENKISPGGHCLCFVVMYQR